MLLGIFKSLIIQEDSSEPPRSEPSHGPVTPSSLPLHVSLENAKKIGVLDREEERKASETESFESMSNDAGSSSSSSSSSGSERLAPQTPKNEDEPETFTIPRSKSSGAIDRIRKHRQDRRASFGEETMDGTQSQEEGLCEKKSDQLSLSRANLQRIRELRNRRTKSVQAGLGGSDPLPLSGANIQRIQRTTSVMEEGFDDESSSQPHSSLSEFNETEENPMLKPRNLPLRVRRTRENSSGSITRNLTGARSGGFSSRSLLTRSRSGTSDYSKQSLMQGRHAQSMGSLSWTKENSPSSPSSRNHTWRTSSSGTAARIRDRRGLSQSEHGSVSGSRIGNLPATTSVKGTTLELLALIKKRRMARQSLSPVPARKTQPRRRRSSSFSPDRARKRLEQKELDARTMCLSIENETSRAESSDALHDSSNSITKTPASTSTGAMPPSSYASPAASDAEESCSASFDSFQDDEEDLSDEESDEESHMSPKGVMEFYQSSQDKFTTQGIDAAHQEKVKQMRAEMEALQKQLRQTEENKVGAMQLLREDVDTRKAKMMQLAKRKIQSHLESEMELKIYTMEVEQTRLKKLKEAMEKGKGELERTVAIAEGDIQNMMKENEHLDAENKEVHRMYTHLSKWVAKKTVQNEKLVKAEEKLKTIHSGSLNLIAQEKLSTLYRRCMYRVAQGVNSCEGFDFELNEDVWDMIKEAEAEAGKEVIDLHEVDEWEKELAENETPLVGMRFSAGLDNSDDVDGLTMSIRTRSTLENLDLSRRSRASHDCSYRTDGTGTSISEEEMYYSESESESEDDEEFEEDMERLDGSVTFYENVLAEVSVNLDAIQMNTLHESKDMLISIFKFMDVDGSGDVDLEEFKVGIELLNKRLPESSRFEDAEELFKLLDKDNSGSIDLEEFERVFDDM
ncbi:unnamed protein product [Cylindrotheca closterium]|uniref:EF-hand domain-containing protein n=1 Tax=Cylindrotheca closterium TaxID=2856 RepID=A0AAD2FNU0_9STRA|nr:unnamed protein product [Cylindrotheca closterium]